MDGWNGEEEGGRGRKSRKQDLGRKGKERKGNSVVQDKHYRDFFRKGSKSMASLSLNWSLKLRGFKPVSS